MALTRSLTQKFKKANDSIKRKQQKHGKQEEEFLAIQFSDTDASLEVPKNCTTASHLNESSSSTTSLQQQQQQQQPFDVSHSFISHSTPNSTLNLSSLITSFSSTNLNNNNNNNVVTAPSSPFHLSRTNSLLSRKSSTKSSPNMHNNNNNNLRTPSSIAPSMVTSPSSSSSTKSFPITPGNQFGEDYFSVKPSLNNTNFYSLEIQEEEDEINYKHNNNNNNEYRHDDDEEEDEEEEYCNILPPTMTAYSSSFRYQQQQMMQNTPSFSNISTKSSHRSAPSTASTTSTGASSCYSDMSSLQAPPSLINHTIDYKFNNNNNNNELLPSAVIAKLNSNNNNNNSSNTNSFVTVKSLEDDADEVAMTILEKLSAEDYAQEINQDQIWSI